MDEKAGTKGKTSYNFISAAMALTLTCSAMSTDLNAPETVPQHIQKVSKTLKNGALEQCGPSARGGAVTGFSAAAGFDNAMEILKDAYPSHEELGEVLRFMAVNDINLHATSATSDDVFAALFIDRENDRKTLMVQAGLYKISDFSPPLRTLIDNLRNGNYDQHEAATVVIFKNGYEGKPFIDIAVTEGNAGLSAFPIKTKKARPASPSGEEPHDPTVAVNQDFWRNPCIDL